MHLIMRTCSLKIMYLTFIKLYIIRNFGLLIDDYLNIICNQTNDINKNKYYKIISFSDCANAALNCKKLIIQGEQKKRNEKQK